MVIDSRREKGASLIFVLTGHRGSGKTSVLDSLKEIFATVEGRASFFDLDREIESRFGKISDIFENHGEDHFRDLEKKCFAELLEKGGAKNIFISVGAGFSGEFPKEAQVIWIRRESDQAGRIFLDRPRLNPKMSPLAEWNIRFQEREKKYFESHHQVLTLPEGKWLLEKTVRFFFSYWFSPLSQNDLSPSYDTTLIPEDVFTKRFEKKIFYQNSCKLEVRQDLIKSFGPNPSKVYFSHRLLKNAPTEGPFKWEDWDLSLGLPKKKFWSLSSHSNQPPTSDSNGQVLKWAPEVESFKSLLLGHQWYLQDRKHRAFLPRSANGRWRWYRRLFGPLMPIHFLKDYKGSSEDQPFWPELSVPCRSDVGFAAVLGGKVDLSWTPSVHYEFFKSRQMPAVSINVGESEFDEAIEVLKELGLKACAVTSPLKKLAFDKCTQFGSERDRAFGSINTLFIDGSKVVGTNTDVLGLEELNKNLKLSNEELVIWGGGGLLPALKEVFPHAAHIPARQGEILKRESVILWSSLRGEEVKWPEPLRLVKKVIDMNYSENSMGRELALMAGSDYLSGEEFFYNQAMGQQAFWSQYL